MNILFINGSPRNNGNTNYLINKITENLDKNIFSCQIIQISDLKFKYCLGCMNCKSTRKCIQNDDYDKLYEYFKKTDIICIASPSYWGYVTGQLKVMFDRTTPYCNTIDGKSTFPENKYGIGISIRAGKKAQENNQVINAIEHFYSHLEVKLLKKFHLEDIHCVNDVEKNISKIIKYSQYLNDWGEKRL